MRQDEFERRFDALWRDRYTDLTAVNDRWNAERRDEEAKRQCRDMLLQYARDSRTVALSRTRKDRARRMFEELGVDPASLELDEFGIVERPAKATERSRILYIERKADLTGEARIGRVTRSKRGRTLYYRGRSFRSLGGTGFKANYRCVETGEEYWISGPHHDGADRLYGERLPVHIDADVREEYWTAVRGRPEWKDRELA